VLQVILSGSSAEAWEAQFRGSRDIGMNVALPEVDGRIISRAVSFKAVPRNPDMETDVVIYEPVSDRVAFVAELAARWVRLLVRQPTANCSDFANYPSRDGRLLMASD